MNCFLIMYVQCTTQCKVEYLLDFDKGTDAAVEVLTGLAALNDIMFHVITQPDVARFLSGVDNCRHILHVYNLEM